MIRLAIYLLLFVIQAASVDGFIARVYKSQFDETMPYRLFVPSKYDSQQKYPLVVWLHGAGGIGEDNIRQISGDQVSGTRIWTNPANQSKHPSFVLVPQSPEIWDDPIIKDLSLQENLVLEILDSVEDEFNIDPDRIYVAGQSDGGTAVWGLITKNPGLFAAAIPLCGAANPDRAAAIATLPIWVFHGARDAVIPVAQSRSMIAAVRKAGGNPRYTEYANAGHDVWSPAFKEPGLVDWLFSQKR